jgi:hypothetical protein
MWTIRNPLSRMLLPEGAKGSASLGDRMSSAGGDRGEKHTERPII